MSTTSHQTAELIPIEDYKIRELLRPKDKQERLEASGVCIKDGSLYVVFDNLHKVAEIKELAENSPNNQLVDTYEINDDDYEGYEDITCNLNTGDFYLLIEAQQAGKPDGKWKSRIIQWNAGLKQRQASWVDAEIKVEGKDYNKGLEGLSWVNRGGTDFLLVLHEKTGAIYPCRPGSKQWKPEVPLHLPPSVQFEDYSCIDIKENLIAVASQESAKLWVGQLHDSGWGFVDEGKVYTFPDYYCNIEGVAWLSSSRIVTVSDKAKRELPDACRKRDQSIHIFDLPPA